MLNDEHSKIKVIKADIPTVTVRSMLLDFSNVTAKSSLHRRSYSTEIEKETTSRIVLFNSLYIYNLINIQHTNPMLILSSYTCLL